MRSAGNFHPDWGYLAPAPGFMRTVRIALVATTIGAIAGAVVVISLVERPGGNDDNASIASHALVISAPIPTSPGAASPNAKTVLKPTPVVVKIPSVLASPAAPAPSTESAPAGPASANKPVTLSAAPAPATASASVTGAAQVQPAAVAPVSVVATPTSSAAGGAEVQPAPESAPATATRDTASEKRAASKRRHADYESAHRLYARRRWRDGGGFGPLLHLFSSGSGDSFDSN